MEDEGALAQYSKDAERCAYLAQIEKYDRIFSAWTSLSEMFITAAVAALAVSGLFAGACVFPWYCGFLAASVACVLPAIVCMRKFNDLNNYYCEMTPKKPRVVGWCKYSDDFADWFCSEHRTEQECADAEQAVVDEIRKNGYKFGGYYHQNGDFGCPVMDDGMVYMVSFRAWGGIMARVWGGEYVDYAWIGEIGPVPNEGFPEDLIKRAERVKNMSKNEVNQSDTGIDMPDNAYPMEDEKTFEANRHVYNEIVRRCPILYRNATPLGCGAGWKGIIETLSSKIEMLNITAGKKYRFEVVASQVKEKFGTLRFYYDVLPTTSMLRRILTAPLVWAFYPYGVNENNCYFHRTIRKLVSPIYDFGIWLRYGGERFAQYRLIADEVVERWVGEAERNSENVCIDCGQNLSPLGGNYAQPRCEMQGWVNYVCPSCAKKRGWTYMYSLTIGERLWAKEYLGSGRRHLNSSVWEDAISLSGKVLKDGKVIEHHGDLPESEDAGAHAAQTVSGQDEVKTGRNAAKMTRSRKTSGKRTRKSAQARKGAKHED